MTEAELLELFNSVPTDAELMAMLPTESDTDDMVAKLLEDFDERDH